MTIVNRRVIGATLGALLVAGAAAIAAQAGIDHAKAATAGTPKRGGTLTFARAFEPVTFDPLKTNGDNGTLWTIVQIYDQLVEYRPGSFTPQPALASPGRSRATARPSRSSCAPPASRTAPR